MSRNIDSKLNKTGAYVLIATVALLVGIAVYVYIAPKTTKDKTSQTTVQNENERLGGKDDAYAAIQDSDIQHVKSEGDVSWDLKDPYYFFKTSSIAALVRVDSIDGGRNFNPVSDQYVYPETIGKMTVLEVYKGDIKAEQQLTYVRMGATLAYDEYLKGLSKAEVSKINYLNKNKEHKKYIKIQFADDIDIEVGKSYVVFLDPRVHKTEGQVEYVMNGMQYGLRELKGSGHEATALNNETKEWESISSFVRL